MIVLWKVVTFGFSYLLTFINIFVKSCFELNCRFDIWHQVLSSTTYILLFLISGKNGDDDDLEDWLNDYLSWTYDAICPHQQPTVLVLTKNRPSEFFLFIYKITSALENNKIVSNLLLPPSILFVTSNHQTTNIVLPKFFYEFFSVCAFEKESKLLLV